MEPVNSRVADTAHVSLRRLAQDERPSLDDSLRRVLPEASSTRLVTAAFTSAL